MLLVILKKYYNILFKPLAPVIVSHFALVSIFYLFISLEFNFILLMCKNFVLSIPGYDHLVGRNM